MRSRCLTLVPLLVVALTVPTLGPASDDVTVPQAAICAECHSNSPTARAMRDGDSRGVAPWDLWGASMMAHASRDPLWRAVVAAEIAATPSRRAEIEATCTRCHAPLGSSGTIAEIDRPGPAGDLARDGVACAACHRITGDDLGEQASFSGGFTLDEEGRIFGPHDRLFSMPMKRHTGFEPTHGSWIADSALCGTCHVLETATLTAKGEPTGHVLPEQTTWLEWRQSSYAVDANGARSCQSCHLPTVDDAGRPIETAIARNPHGYDFPPVQRRSPYGRHVLTGGNALIPTLLAREGDDLTPPEELEDRAAAARELLARETGRVEIVSATRAGDRLDVRVLVTNLTGHKLPSGQPARRAWLRLTVREPGGRVVFDSGRWDERGRIVDGRGSVLDAERAGGPVEPHRAEVTGDGQVAIFEAVMADADGRPTWRLLRGATFLKDDRLLPVGWHTPVDPRIRPRGVDGDADFGPGGDVVAYRIAVPADVGDLELEARLVYQTVGARFLAELTSVDVPEVRAFAGQLRPGDLAPSLIAADHAVVTR